MAKSKCGKPDCACDSKSRAFGGATWIAVLAAVIIVGAALWLSLKSSRPGARTATTAAASDWHPEPAFLLQHQVELKLDPKQVRHVQVAMRVWNLKRAAYDVQFKTYDTDSGAAMAMLARHQPASGQFAQLLASFDKDRARAWEAATNTLNPDQVVAIESIRERIAKTGSHLSG